jgi:hydrogenase maturation protease
VIAIGNVLLGDDGFGPTVLALLASLWDIPSRVELIDAGTPGLDLAGLLCGREAVVLIDTVAASGPPGELRLYRDHELQRALVLQPRVSPHDPAVAEALAIAELAGGVPPSVLLVGVVPESAEVGPGLSDAVTAAVPEAAAAGAAALRKWGAAPIRRREPIGERPWWVQETAAPAAG